jgi:hypothetical protein
VVKVKTRDGKSEEEWKKKETNRFGTKSPCYQVFSNSAFEKGRVSPHGKVPVFLDKDILANGMDNHISNFAQKVMWLVFIE